VYVRLKHTLSELALRALTAPPARRAAAWLRAYCEVVWDRRTARDTPPGAPAFDVPLAVLAARARRAGGGARVPGRLPARGLLERDGDVVRLPEPYRAHFPYLRRHARRLAAVLRAGRVGAPRGVAVRIARAAALFDAGLFFECHEYVEGIWRTAPARDRAFYQGIILVAAAFYHYEKGNRHGFRSKLTGGIERLAPYLPAYRGVLIDRWLRRLGPWRARAEAGATDGPLAPARIPRIPLTRARRSR
jgi:hypothetical protein